MFIVPIGERRLIWRTVYSLREGLSRTLNKRAGDVLIVHYLYPLPNIPRYFVHTNAVRRGATAYVRHEASLVTDSSVWAPILDPCP